MWGGRIQFGEALYSCEDSIKKGGRIIKLGPSNHASLDVVFTPSLSHTDQTYRG